MKYLSFEKCGVDNLKALQSIAIQTFKATYEHHNKPENFIPYLKESFSDEKLTEELLHPNSVFYLAVYENEVVGYVKVNEGIAQTEMQPNTHLEIERIYLLQTTQGLGFGRQMIEFVEQLARDKQKSHLWLGVWSKNENAIGFYTKMGFKTVATHIFQLGDDAQLDYVMEKKIK